jgi:hypothetical protein
MIKKHAYDEAKKLYEKDANFYTFTVVSCLS